MARHGGWRGIAAVFLSQPAGVGCAPTVDVLGVYFPGWLVSTVTGVASAYGLVYWLGRRPGARALAESGIFFCSLAVGVALAIWWLFFSGF
jgi:hypothetical protein